MAGIEPRTVTLPPMSDEAILNHIVAKHCRRDLTQAQKAAAAANAEDIREKIALAADARMKSGKGADGSGRKGNKKNPVEHVPHGLDTGRTRDKIGKVFGVSGRAVDKARKVKEESPEAFKQIESGEKSLRQAEREISPKKPGEEHKRLIVDCCKKIEQATLHIADADPIKVSAAIRQILRQSGIEKGASVSVKNASVDAVCEHYQKFHPRSKPGGKERSLIAARLKDGYSVQDLREAIDGCHDSPYHSGENQSGKKYQRLELIMRDSSKVTDFIEQIGAQRETQSERERRNDRVLEQWLRRQNGNN